MSHALLPMQKWRLPALSSFQQPVVSACQSACQFFCVLFHSGSWFSARRPYHVTMCSNLSHLSLAVFTSSCAPLQILKRFSSNLFFFTSAWVNGLPGFDTRPFKRLRGAFRPPPFTRIGGSRSHSYFSQHQHSNCCLLFFPIDYDDTGSWTQMKNIYCS